VSFGSIDRPRAKTRESADGLNVEFRRRRSRSRLRYRRRLQQARPHKPSRPGWPALRVGAGLRLDETARALPPSLWGRAGAGGSRRTQFEEPLIRRSSRRGRQLPWLGATPALAAAFYVAGPEAALAKLTPFLRNLDESGAIAVKDTELAAEQLAAAWLGLSQLKQSLGVPPSRDRQAGEAGDRDHAARVGQGRKLARAVKIETLTAIGSSRGSLNFRFGSIAVADDLSKVPEIRRKALRQNS
jgi:AefR-like transcriptional repressor, C-terminal domain